MLKIFLLTGGSGNGDFHFVLRATKLKLEKTLLDIEHKEKAASNDYMMEHQLTYRDICNEAEDAYRTQFDRREWPPARNPRDSS